MKLFCKTCGKDQADIEFYCKTCSKAICRDCLLRYHLNLDINPSTEEMREKQELLDQYERKTMSERMTVSLHAELNIKIEDTEDGKSKMHEIMDIKMDFMTVAKLH